PNGYWMAHTPLKNRSGRGADHFSPFIDLSRGIAVGSGDVRLVVAPDAPLRGVCSSATGSSAPTPLVGNAAPAGSEVAAVSSSRRIRGSAHPTEAGFPPGESDRTVHGKHHRAQRPDVWLYPEPAAIG